MRKLIKTKEAAKILNKDIQTVRSWGNSGRLDCVKTPGNLFFYLDEVQEAKDLLTIKDISDMYGVHKVTVMIWKNKGKIKSHPKHKYLFKRDDHLVI